jgi:hypothetical protein
MDDFVPEKKSIINRENAIKGGVKTPEGKEISKYNALKHGILSDVVTSYDKPGFEDMYHVLRDELKPCFLIEEVLVERISYYLLRLQRVARAETEHLKKCLDPTIKEPFFDDILKERVVKKGYEPKIKQEDIEPLYVTFFRYEKSLENRLYRALLELGRIQKVRQCASASPDELSGERRSDSN